jgi:hypothetical protein
MGGSFVAVRAECGAQVAEYFRTAFRLPTRARPLDLKGAV